jgi:L-cysteine desulfidase
MQLTDYLAAEWRPALGCTEPAAVAWAAALAAEQGRGEVRSVRLVCDSRTYKNCYAVGLPNADGATGILWALGLGAHLPDGSLGLRSFEGTTPGTIEAAGSLLAAQGVHVEVDALRNCLLVDVTVVRQEGVGRAVIEQEHTNLARLEKDGRLVGGAESAPRPLATSSIREEAAALSIQALMDLARTLGPPDRERLREGVALNLAIARHGLSLLPPGFADPAAPDYQASLSRLVGAGVFARMSGESLTVMTLAGSGNKGITVAVPVSLWGRESRHAEARIEEALAFACLMTTAATARLGTLSAVCGAANAAGIGIASALVFLEGGTSRQVGLAIANMVGNVAGMICDGAKIGCAMKTMTGVDAAFRAAHLALADIGIPATDGIVGADGESSLANLGRLAQHGMAGVDAEILRIMQDKLRRASATESTPDASADASSGSPAPP